MSERAATRPVWRVRRLTSVDSTNRLVLDEARRGEPEGLVVVADQQTAGRGRHGRQWIAPPGSSLLVSVLLRPGLPAERAHVVTAAAGLAVAAAVERVAGFEPALKWPNDLVVTGDDDLKLAGLLADAEVAGGELRALVIGVGCNVRWPDPATSAFPEDLRGTATACNLVSGRAVDLDDLLQAFLDELAARYATLPAVPGEYRARLATIGRRVRVEKASATGDGDALEGLAVDVDDAGRLVVRDDHGTDHTFAVGDVIHLRNA